MVVAGDRRQRNGNDAAGPDEWKKFVNENGSGTSEPGFGQAGR